MFVIVLQVLNILLLHFHFLIALCLLLAPGSNQLCFPEGKNAFFLGACMFDEKRSPQTPSYLWFEGNLHRYPWEQAKSFSIKTQ